MKNSRGDSIGIAKKSSLIRCECQPGVANVSHHFACRRDEHDRAEAGDHAAMPRGTPADPHAYLPPRDDPSEGIRASLRRRRARERQRQRGRKRVERWCGRALAREPVRAHPPREDRARHAGDAHQVVTGRPETKGGARVHQRLDPTRRVRLAQRSHGHRGRVGAGVQLRGARRAGVSRARPAFAGEA